MTDHARDAARAVAAFARKRREAGGGLVVTGFDAGTRDPCLEVRVGRVDFKLRPRYADAWGAYVKCSPLPDRRYSGQCDFPPSRNPDLDVAAGKREGAGAAEALAEALGRAEDILLRGYADAYWSVDVAYCARGEFADGGARARRRSFGHVPVTCPSLPQAMLMFGKAAVPNDAMRAGAFEYGHPADVPESSLVGGTYLVERDDSLVDGRTRRDSDEAYGFRVRKFQDGGAQAGPEVCAVMARLKAAPVDAGERARVDFVADTAEALGGEVEALSYDSPRPEVLFRHGGSLWRAGRVGDHDHEYLLENIDSPGPVSAQVGLCDGDYDDPSVEEAEERGDIERVFREAVARRMAAALGSSGSCAYVATAIGEYGRVSRRAWTLRDGSAKLFNSMTAGEALSLEPGTWARASSYPNGECWEEARLSGADGDAAVVSVRRTSDGGKTYGPGYTVELLPVGTPS